jgi:hypothetical protein
MDADAHQATVDRAVVDVPSAAPRPLHSPALETCGYTRVGVASLAQRCCRRPCHGRSLSCGAHRPAQRGRIRGQSVGCYLNNAKRERPVNMRSLVMPPSFLG